MVKKVLLFPLKVIWYFIAWPAILGWKAFKFLVCNQIVSTSVGGKEDSGAAGLIQLGLGVVLLVGIPLTVWFGAPMAIRHYLGYHGPLNFVCVFGFKENFPAHRGQIKDPATLTTDTNKAEKQEKPVTE